MTPGRFTAGIAAVLFLPGCADRPAPAVTTASDSAGVHIVKNAAPTLEPAMAWRLDSTPIMEIGAELEHPERDLNQVAGAYRLQDGRIAIMSAGNSQLLFYDSTGNWIETVGRQGRGPGEFQSPYGFWRRPGDTLVVFDFQSRRITILNDSGGFVRSYMVPSPGRTMFPIPNDIYDDGRLLVNISVFDTASRTGTYRDPTAFVSVSREGEFTDMLGIFPGREMYGATIEFDGRSFPSPAPVPLGGDTHAVTAGQNTWIGINEGYEIRRLDPDGAVKLIVRRIMTPVEVQSQDIERGRALALEQLEGSGSGMPEQMRTQLENRIKEAPYPERLAWYSGLTMDDYGYLWVESPRLPGDFQYVFSVFGADGYWACDVTMPERFRPTHIALDHVTGIWMDEDDVEYVRVYELIKPGA